MSESTEENGKQSKYGMAWEYDNFEGFQSAGLKGISNRYLSAIRAAQYSRNLEWPRDRVHSYKHYARRCADHILESQYPMKLTWVRADGGESFRDVVVGNDEGNEITVSLKHNSEEVYGPRIEARREYFIKKKERKTSQQILTRYREDDTELRNAGLSISDDIADYLRGKLGSDWLDLCQNNSSGLPWYADKDFSLYCRQKLGNAIRLAVLRLRDKQQDVGVFFSEIIGAGDHYLVRKAGGDGRCFVIGYNFDGTLPVYKMTRPARVTNAENCDTASVLVAFSGGWQMKWRAHTRHTLIKPNEIGVSVTIASIPPKSHSILIKP